MKPRDEQITTLAWILVIGILGAVGIIGCTSGAHPLIRTGGGNGQCAITAHSAEVFTSITTASPVTPAAQTPALAVAVGLLMLLAASRTPMGRPLAAPLAAGDPLHGRLRI